MPRLLVRPLTGLFVALIAHTAFAGKPRTVEVQLQQLDPAGGGTRWRDLLSDQLPTESWSMCVGRIRPELTWTKNPDDSITVTGPVRYFERNNCKRRERGRQEVTLTIAPDAETVVPIEIPAGSTLVRAQLLLRNGRPTCTGRHVRFRATMDVVDDDLFGSNETGFFRSSQVSVFLEPGEIPGISFRRCVDAEVVGDLLTRITEVAADHVTADLRLILFEGSGCDTNDNDASRSQIVVLANGTQQTVRLRAADDGNVVEIEATLENGGEQCWTQLIVPPLAGIGFFTIPPPLTCTPMLQGCYVRADGRAGWVRVTGETCTGTGLTRRCTVEGSGQGLVCPGVSWTFQGARIDQDCQGARVPLACLGNGAALLRVLPGGATIGREDRTGTTALVPGTACP